MQLRGSLCPITVFVVTMAAFVVAIAALGIPTAPWEIRAIQAHMVSPMRPQIITLQVCTPPHHLILAARRLSNAPAPRLVLIHGLR